MATELRKTGIQVIGELPWGAHFCHFHETEQDLFDTVLPYFKAGLEDNEFCLWVVAESLTEEKASRMLQQTVPNFDHYLAEQSIEILSYKEWYLKGGAFDLHRVIDGWREKLDQALARGYAGMRVAACTAWLQKKDWKDLRAYETELSESIADQRMIVLCAYSLAASGAADILDVAQTHELTVARRNGDWEIVETSELKQAKSVIKRLNEELEQRVVERTRELVATNEKLRREIAEHKRTEEKLQSSEDRLRLVIDTIPALVGSTLPDGSVDFVNERWREYFGLSLEDARGWGWKEVVHPEDHARHLDEWRAALATGKPFEREARLRRADGEYRWFLSRAVPLRDGLGNIVKWYGMDTDIEDRKRAEELLRRSEDYLAEAQRLSSTGSFGWHMSSGELFWSEETFRIFAYDRATKPTVKLVLERTHPDDLALVQQTLDRATHDGKDWEFKHRLLMPDGSVKYVHVVAHAVRDESDNLGFVGAVRDVTSTTRAEEELRESERKFHNLVDMIPAAVYMCNLSGCIIYYNRRATELCGREPLPGETDQRFCLSLRLYYLDGTLMPHDQSPMAEALRTGRSERNKEVIIERPDQSRITVLANIAVIKNERGEIIGAINCFEDITERKQAEETLRSLSSQLLHLQDEERRRIARDLHDSTAQSLSALAMFLSQIEESAAVLEPRERQFIAESRELAGQCLREIRTLSYLLHPPFLDERGLASALQWYIEGFARRSNIEVRLDVASDLGRLSANIELALFRIVQESLTNIHQHSGSPVASIRLLRESHWVILTIADAGRGMTAEVLERIRTSGSPLGVGIAGMQERVRQLGGRLDIQSGYHGTTLAVTLPIADGDS